MTARTLRLLMLWTFVALQTLVPFIHAHAGVVQLSHGGLLHGHPGAHTDAAYHAIAAQEHGAEFDVAQGTPVRKTESGVLDGPQTAAVNPQPFMQQLALHWVTPSSAPPLLFLPLPEHIRPHTLAPPFA